jgi:hypothetical protein
METTLSIIVITTASPEIPHQFLARRNYLPIPDHIIFYHRNRSRRYQKELGVCRYNPSNTKKRACPLLEMVWDSQCPLSRMVCVTNITPI